MASVLSVSTPALACSAAARRPAARSATARWAAPRAELAMRQSRPAALATQRAALAGDSSTHAIGARRIQRIQRQVVHAAPRAALDSVIAPLKAGPAPATYQATAIAAAVLALKLAWEARNGGGGLMLAAGYAVHAGAAYAIAAAGGKAGSETLKRMNAGLVLSAVATLALRYGGSLRYEGWYLGIAAGTLVASFLASKVEMFKETATAVMEAFTKQLKAPASPVSGVYSAVSLASLYWAGASLWGAGWGHLVGHHGQLVGALLLSVAMAAFALSDDGARSEAKAAHGALGAAAALVAWHGHWAWHLRLNSAHFWVPTLATVLAALVAHSFVKK